MSAYHIYDVRMPKSISDPLELKLCQLLNAENGALGLLAEQLDHLSSPSYSKVLTRVRNTMKEALGCHGGCVEQCVC